MRHISANKLNRLWQNGILPGLARKLEVTKVLKTQEQVEANTNPDNVASAVVVGEVINNLGGCQLAQEGNDFYIVGADSVRKKLGSGGTLKFNLTISSGYARPTSDIYPSAMVERGVYNITINLANKTGSVGGSASVICYEYIGGGVEQLVAGRASISASITNIQLIE